MKIRKTKKGFTIVELVIVIAVIGILAAILVPTFVSLTNRANEASDNALVNNLNKALKVQEGEQGKKPETFQGAIDNLKKEGYLLEQLNTRSGKTLVWDMKEDQFVLNPTNEQTGANFWKIVENTNDVDATKYSIYAGSKWTGNASGFKYGFDAGENTEIAEVNYTNNDAAQEVVIRTNGGVLKIDAVTSKVHHYGISDGVIIESVAPSSFYENGTIGFANIKNGRFVIKESAKIEGIFLVPTNNEFNSIKLGVVGEAKLPEIARADITLANGDSKLVVEIQTLSNEKSVDEHPEYVWISKNNDQISAEVSSSSETIVEVENPTQAAAAAKEESTESATPIDENCEARIGAKGYLTLVDAFNSINESGEGAKLVILKDIDFSTSTYNSYNWDHPLSIKANNVVLDLNNKVIYNMDNAAIRLGNMLTAQGRYSNITVQNGTLRVRTVNGVACSYALAVGGVDGVLVKNVTTYGGMNVFSQANDVVIEDCNVQGSKYYTVCAQVGSHVTIRGNSFTKNTDSSVKATAMFWVHAAGTESDIITPDNPTGAHGPSSITIESGKFEIDVDGTFHLSGSGRLKPVVKGGTFNFDPTTYLAEGYVATGSSDGTWTVKEA